MAHFFASCWFLLRRIDVVVCFIGSIVVWVFFWGAAFTKS